MVTIKKLIREEERFFLFECELMGTTVEAILIKDGAEVFLNEKALKLLESIPNNGGHES